MKQLTRPSRTLPRIKPPAPKPRYIVIKIPAYDLPSPNSIIIDIEAAQIHTNPHHENRLQHAIRAEQDYLKATSAEFLEAFGTFLGAIFRWLVWRIVLPVTVVGMLLLALT